MNLKKLQTRLNSAYPFFFAAFPVLSLYATNSDEVALSEIWVPLIFTWSVTALLLLLFKKFFKLGNKAQILTVLSLFMVFSYEHFVNLSRGLNISYISFFDLRYIAFWVSLFIILAYLILTTKSTLNKLTQILVVISLALFLIPTLAILMSANTNTSSQLTSPLEQEKKQAELTQKTPELSYLPDIYYLIFDRYPNQKTLEKEYDFDNSEFLRNLEEKGFYIAKDSTSNYLKTAHSLASSLNMEYLSELSEKVGEDSTSLLPLYRKIEDNAVQDYLKSQGYQYIHLGSWWHATSRNRNADVNYNLHLLPEFPGVLFRTTIFYPVTVYLGIYDVREEQRQRVLFKYEKLKEIPAIDGPTFTFAHMLIPHDPYVLDAEGNLVDWETILSRSTKENFLNQLMFVNKKNTEIVEEILSISDSPPIIIIQSDEGPFPLHYQQNKEDINWESATEDDLNTKMKILNALYLPGPETKDTLYQSITPVNTFRLIFNKYFGEDLELLPDRNYIFENVQKPFKFKEVTEKVN